MFKQADLGTIISSTLRHGTGYTTAGLAGAGAGLAREAYRGSAPDAPADYSSAALQGALGGLGLRAGVHALASGVRMANNFPVRNKTIRLVTPFGDTPQDARLVEMSVADAVRNPLATKLMRSRPATNEEITKLRSKMQFRDKDLVVARARQPAAEAYVPGNSFGHKDYIMLGSDSSLGVAAHEMTHAAGKSLLPLDDPRRLQNHGLHTQLNPLYFRGLAEEARANWGAFNHIRKNFGLGRALQEAPGLMYAQSSYLRNMPAGNVVTGVPLGIGGALAYGAHTEREKKSALDAYAAGRAFAYHLAKQAADASGFAPPEAVQSAAKKGLDLHGQGRSGDGLQPQTVSEAKAMAAGEKLSLEKIRRMNAWFARHASDEKAGWDKAGQETPGYVAWLLWGGDAGRRWAAGLAETDDD